MDNRRKALMKKWPLIISLTCILLLTGIIAFLIGWGRKLYGEKPFKDMDASQIASATVRLTPPDQTAFAAWYDSYL